MEDSLKKLLSLPAGNFVTMAIVLGILLLDDLDSPTQNSLGAFLMLIGQLIVTYAGQRIPQEKRLERHPDAYTVRLLEVMTNLDQRLQRLEANEQLPPL